MFFSRFALGRTSFALSFEPDNRLAANTHTASTCLNHTTHTRSNSVNPCTLCAAVAPNSYAIAGGDAFGILVADGSGPATVYGNVGAFYSNEDGNNYTFVQSVPEWGVVVALNGV